MPMQLMSRDFLNYKQLILPKSCGLVFADALLLCLNVRNKANRITGFSQRWKRCTGRMVTFGTSCGSTISVLPTLILLGKLACCRQGGQELMRRRAVWNAM